MTTKIFRALCLFAGVACLLPARAYDLRYITTSNGLSNSSVLSIIHRRDGRVAFGTCDGVCAYDGVHAWREPSATNCQVEGNIVEAMAEGAAGVDWYLTDHGLTRYEDFGRNVTFYPQFQGVRKLRTNPAGDVFLISGDSLHFSHYNNNLMQSQAIEISHFQKIRDYALTDNYLYIFSSIGIFRYNINDDGHKYLIDNLIQIDKMPVEVASNDGEAEFLINSDGMLRRFDMRSGDFRTYCSLSDERRRRGTISQIIDYYGVIFIGFDTSGVLCVDERDGRFTLRELPIQAGVTSICKSLASHIVWFGTDGQGVVMYSEPTIASHSLTFNDLWLDNRKPVRALRLDDDGTLWIGTKGNGVISVRDFDENADTRKLPRQLFNHQNSLLSHDIVYHFAASARPIFWICTEAGIDYYSRASSTIARVDCPPELRYVVRAWENADTLWMATLGMGIFRATIGGTPERPQLSDFHCFMLDDGERSANYFFGMAHDDSGRPFFANRGRGVFTISGDELVSMPLRETYENKSVSDAFDVLCVGEDLWIGTADGIIIQRADGTENHLTTRDGLPNNIIHSLIKDDDGNVYATTNSGFVCFLHAEPTAPIFYADNGVTEYCDGAASVAGNSALLGGINGFSVVHCNEHQPIIDSDNKLIFTNLSILGQPADIHSFLTIGDGVPTLRLDYTQATFSLSLASLNYVDEPHTEYCYRFATTEEWINNGIERKINFLRMPAGNHTFYIKYINRITGRESAEFQLNISILPPWYWAWWSKCLYAIIILMLIIWVLRHIWQRNERRRQMEMQRREEQQRDALYEQKLNFLTNVVHELNTPLTLIYGPCERILNYAKADDFVHKYAVQIRQNLQRIHYLIQEVIDFRRVTTAHLVINIKNVNVSSFVADTVDAFREMATENRIKLNADIAPDIIWHTDERALLRICNNLVSNAFKYTIEGGVVDVSLKVDGEKLRFEVSNTGKGIAPEDRQRIFNYYSIFENVDESAIRGLTTRNGLGMAICHKVVQMLGGTIDVESEVGQYAKFIVLLPNAELAADASSETISANAIMGIQENISNNNFGERPRKPLKPSKFADATILVIDDNQEILDLLVDSLDEYRVVVAASAEAAIETMKDALPDLIITDIMMPGTDGLTLTQNIKQNKHTMHIPLIILSAKTAEDERIEGIECGADAYISKPFNINYLKATINQLLDNRAKLKEYYNTSASAYTYSSGKLMKNEDSQFVAEVTQVLNANLKNPDLTPDGLAELLNISSRSLYRRFSEMQLPSPKEFMRIHRVESAARLLATTNMTVQEIIYDCGFNTRTQFYNDFRKHFGKTPKEYRAQNNVKGEEI